MTKRDCHALSIVEVHVGQHFLLANVPGTQLIESHAFKSAERRLQIRMPVTKTLEYFCENQSWGTVTQKLLDGVCTVNICDVHFIDKKRVYYQVRIHCRNLTEYRGIRPVSKKVKTSLSDVDYDTNASVSVSQTGSECDDDTESDSDSDYTYESQDTST
jgi:hypothetical protein